MLKKIISEAYAEAIGPFVAMYIDERLTEGEKFADDIIQKLKDSGIDKKINAEVRQGMCNVIYLTVEENADYAYNKADIYAPERGKEILKIILED